MEKRLIKMSMERAYHRLSVRSSRCSGVTRSVKRINIDCRRGNHPDKHPRDVAYPPFLRLIPHGSSSLLPRRIFLLSVFSLPSPQYVGLSAGALCLCSMHWATGAQPSSSIVISCLLAATS